MQMAKQWFQNTETGERSWLNPVLTPNLPRERGVDIQGIILV